METHGYFRSNGSWSSLICLKFRENILLLGRRWLPIEKSRRLETQDRFAVKRPEGLLA